MGNSAQISMGAESSSPEDVGADLYIATFHTLKTESENEDGGTESFSTEARIAERIQLQAGLLPSYAEITIPMDNFPLDESPFACTFTRGSVADRLKFNTRCTIAYSYAGNGALSAILTGTVIEVKHDASRDALVVFVVDDRWILSRITCFGQMQFDPSKSARNKEAFISADELIFNQNGMPDCMDGPNGPAFAPFGFFGWKSTDHAEPSPGQARTRSRSWRVVDAVSYLWRVHYVVGAWVSTGLLNYGTESGRWVPENLITWPKGLGNQLVLDRAQDGLRFQRPLHHFKLENLDLNEALNLLAKRAGPFELTMVPGGTAGDNGNDVDAGLMNLDPSGLYASMSAAFEGTVSSLSSAFSASYETFSAAFANTLSVMDREVKAFQDALGKPFEQFTGYLKSTADRMQDILDGSDGSNYQANVLPIYRQFLAEVGTQLEGHPGMFAAPDGSTSTIPVDASQRKINLKRTLHGLEQSRSTMAFVSYDRRGGANKLTVPGLSGKSLAEAMGGGMIGGGYVKESIRNYWHKVLILGDPPMFERLFSMDDSPEAGLEPAWTDSDELAWQNYISDNGMNRDAFDQACMLWPLVYAAYRVPENFDYMAGTKWAEQFKYRGRKNPRIKSTLLTSVSDDESEGNPANFQPRDIPIEVNFSGTWKIVTYYNNLELSHDGSIFIVKGLRDSDDHPTWSGSLSDPFNIAARSVRATLAVEADFRITGEAGGTGKDNKAGDPNGTYARVYDDGSSPITTYVGTSNKLDYIEWLRHESAQPVGSQIPASQRVFPARCTEGNELFTDRVSGSFNPDKPEGQSGGRIVAHALARLENIKRIEYTGQIVFHRYDPGMMPGAKIAGIVDSVIPVMGTFKSITLLATAQECFVEFG